MNFIKRHKGVLIVSVVCLILVGLATVAVYRMFNPNSDKTVYGDRLEGAPEVDREVIETIKNDIIATEIVESIKYETNVAVVKFYIDVKENTKIEDAEELSGIILEKLSTDIMNFYDIEIYLTQKNGEDSNYPAIGYHSKNAEYFSWTLNKVGDTDE